MLTVPMRKRYGTRTGVPAPGRISRDKTDHQCNGSQNDGDSRRPPLQDRQLATTLLHDVITG